MPTFYLMHLMSFVMCIVHELDKYLVAPSFCDISDQRYFFLKDIYEPTQELVHKLIHSLDLLSNFSQR